MTSPGRYTSPDSSFGRSAGSAAARGGILVGVAVVIGFLLLWIGGVGGSGDIAVVASDTDATEETETDAEAGTDDTGDVGTVIDNGDTVDTGTEDETDATFDEGTDGTETDTSGEALADDGTAVADDGTVADPTTTRAPGEVRAAVANGTGTAGLAGERSGVLSTAGYTTDAVNSANDTALSTVYYVDGYAAEAEAVAVLLGGDASLLRIATDAQLASAVAEENQAQVAGFHIIAVLGTDGRLG